MSRIVVLGLGTLLLLIGVNAPIAQANFTASTYPTTLTAESALGNDVIKTEAGNVECKAHYSGTLSSSSEGIELTPTFTGCKAFGFLEAGVTFEGCKFFVAKWKVFRIVGFGCKNIVIHSATCKMAIPPQNPTGKVDLTNNLGAGDISTQATVTGIAYEVTQDGFGCPFSGTGKKTGATFTQVSAITLDSTNGASVDVYE